jgi:hypothetical protein
MAAPRIGRRTIIEVLVALVMLALAFSAIAASDVSATGTHLYWSVLVVIFAAVALVVERMHSGRSGGRRILNWVLQWAGVLAAVQLVYLLVSTGRIANADTGLACGVILALGTFTAGVHGNWRLMVVGLALGLATAGVAFFEEYLWVLLGVAVLTVLALVVGRRLFGSRRAGT